MTSIILFLGILILGYISTNFIFSKIKSRYYIPSGIEHIFFGIIIGNSFANWFNITFGTNLPQVIDRSLLAQLSPAISAAIGFVGFVYGLRFKIKNLAGTEPEHWRVFLAELLFSLIILGGGSYLVMSYVFPGFDFISIITASYVIAVAGLVSSNYLVNQLAEKYKITGPVIIALKNSSQLNINFSILLFGLVFGINHIGTKEYLTVRSSEWVLIALLLAVFIGFLFFIFLAREQDENKLFVAVLGITIFTSGTAYYLNYSPLFMNFILGFVISNVSRISEKIEKSLTRMFNPLGVLIVVMAGFFWVPAGLYVFAVAAVLMIVLRYFTKILAGKTAYITSFDKTKLCPSIGKGLLFQDIIVCSMMIDYLNVYKNPLTPIVFSAVLSSVLFYSLISFSAAKNILVDVGEISQESK